MLDENWTPSDAYAATLYFHCPNTNCDGHVKLRDRAAHHATRCDRCGLEFAIGADPELGKGERRPLTSALEREGSYAAMPPVIGNKMRPLLVFVVGIILGLLVGIFIGAGWIR